jgi:hypothetical protein
MEDYEIRISIECMLHHRRQIRHYENEIKTAKGYIEKILKELTEAGVKTEFEKTWRKENPTGL